MWCYVVCREQYWLGKIWYIQKRHMDEFICFTFLSMIRRYIATFQKRTENSLYNSIFFIFPLSSTHTRFKNRRLL